MELSAYMLHSLRRPGLMLVLVSGEDAFYQVNGSCVTS